MFSFSEIRLIAAVGGFILPCLLRADDPAASGLAAAWIVAPRNLVLTAARPQATKPIVVIIQNRSAETKVIPDAATLERLVGLQIAPLGEAAVQSELVPPPSFPITLRPGAKLAVVFHVTFELRDPAARVFGFQYAATIDGVRQTQDPAANAGAASAPVAPTWGVMTVNAAGATPQERGVRSRALQTRGADNGASITASAMQVGLKKGAPMSDPITFTAKWDRSFFVSGWEETPSDTAADMAFKNAQNSKSVKAQWQNPGDYTVKVFLIHSDGAGNFDSAEPTVDVHVIRVQFKDENDADLADPLRVGITTHGGIFEADRSQNLKAKVEPQSQVGNVEVMSDSGSLLSVFDQQTSGDTITFKAEGVGTEGSSSRGDAKIKATIKNASGPASKAEQAVSVVRPAMILQQIVGSQYHENIQLNTLTTPSDPRIPANLVVLATFYGWFITVPVRDQFGDSIGDSKLYLDAPVYENFLVGGDLQALKRTNMKLGAGSSYLDPVGVPIGRGYPSPHPSLMNLPPYNSLIATQHVANPNPAFFGPKAQPNTVETNTNTLQVEIATFPCKPSIKRVLMLDAQGNLTLPTVEP